MNMNEINSVIIQIIERQEDITKFDIIKLYQILRN